jgi:type I restriction enzyme S subunit
MPSRIPSVNPGAFPDEQFTLWSIPSYDAGKPEQVFGRDVGSSKKAVQDGDVLLSKIVPHIRRAWKVSVPNGHRQIASSEWITFRHDAFLSDYIRHFLLTDQFHVQFMGTVAGVGGSLLRAQPKSVAKIGIPLRPLEEQRRIVGLLDRAAEIRRRADAARAKARAIIPALFLDLFGDPATNPKGWPIHSLGELGELDRGRSRHRPRNAPELYGGEHPFIQTGDVANSEGHILSYQQTYSDLGLAQSRLWPAGTLCITIAANIGKTGILGFDACFPDSVVGFTPASEVTSEFVMFVLNFMQAEMEARAPQAAQKNINLQVLRGLEVPVPPLPLQTAFAEQAQRLEATARALDSAAAKAAAMAAALSAEVFGPSTDNRIRQTFICKD